MSISRQDIEKVALLARLQLKENELQMMTEQLAQIVAYVDLLAEVDTEGVESTPRV
jgi:aspartyl-tRNA(Asn)/glutamyl-tRNA(Gln) amidotransferase subunit C